MAYRISHFADGAWVMPSAFCCHRKGGLQCALCAAQWAIHHVPFAIGYLLLLQ